MVVDHPSISFAPHLTTVDTLTVSPVQSTRHAWMAGGSVIHWVLNFFMRCHAINQKGLKKCVIPFSNPLSVVVHYLDVIIMSVSLLRYCRELQKKLWGNQTPFPL